LPVICGRGSQGYSVARTVNSADIVAASVGGSFGVEVISNQSDLAQTRKIAQSATAGRKFGAAISDEACVRRGVYGKPDSVNPLRGACVIRKAGRNSWEEFRPKSFRTKGERHQEQNLNEAVLFAE
jgi:hypothetical protein